jgi:hypothetical protein
MRVLQMMSGPPHARVLCRRFWAAVVKIRWPAAHVEDRAAAKECKCRAVVGARRSLGGVKAAEEELLAARRTADGRAPDLVRRGGVYAGG